MSKQIKLSGFFKKTNSENAIAGCSTSNIASDNTILTQCGPRRKSANHNYSHDNIAFGFTFVEEFGL